MYCRARDIIQEEKISIWNGLEQINQVKSRQNSVLVDSIDCTIPVERLIFLSSNARSRSVICNSLQFIFFIPNALQQTNKLRIRYAVKATHQVILLILLFLGLVGLHLILLGLALFVLLALLGIIPPTP